MELHKTFASDTLFPKNGYVCHCGSHCDFSCDVGTISPYVTTNCNRKLFTKSPSCEATSTGRCHSVNNSSESSDRTSNISCHSLTMLNPLFLTSWLPGFARDPLPLPLSSSLSPLSYSSLPSPFLPPSDCPASPRITAFPRYFFKLYASLLCNLVGWVGWGLHV